MPLTSSQIEEAIVIDSSLKSTLPNILNLHVQNNSSEKTVICTLNKLISVSKTRPQGLEYLNLVLNNCSVEVVSENALHWINNCLVKYPGDTLKEIKLITIGNIVENVHNVQDFTKKFVSDHLNQVLEMCLSSTNNPHEIEAALGTLTICMKYYSSWFTSHKTRIETALLRHLESSVDPIVDKAAVAFHFLQQVGGGGVDGSNHIISFSTNFRKLCATVQRLFDKFFENETEFDDFSMLELTGFEFTESVHDSQKYQQMVARRIQNCLRFMTTMMIKGFPVAKEIKPLEVLDIIRRGTSIHHCVSTDDVNSISNYQFSVLLNDIQVQLLQLLRVTIIWLGANNSPFCFTISKVLVDCLKKASNCDCFRTDWLYKETIFKVLDRWIRISKGSLHSHFQNQLISCILINITPIKSRVALTIDTSSGKNKSKSAKRKAVTEKIISGRQENVNSAKTEAEKYGDIKICSIALDTLKYLLTCSHCKSKTELLTEVYSSTLATLNQINTSNTPHPYTDPTCQAKLYQVLVSFYEQDTAEALPRLQLAIHLLNKGANSPDRRVSDVCERGLGIIEKLCQPLCPSLGSIDSRQIEVVGMTAKPVDEVPVEAEGGETGVSVGEAIKILDVSIVQAAVSVMESEGATDGNEEVRNVATSQESNLNTEIDILKDEVLNYSTIEIDRAIEEQEVDLNDVSIEIVDSEEENASNPEESQEEPPSKKVKSEEIDAKEMTVEKDSEVVFDDVEFNDDSFVDEVKDY